MANTGFLTIDLGKSVAIESLSKCQCRYSFPFRLLFNYSYVSCFLYFYFQRTKNKIYL